MESQTPISQSQAQARKHKSPLFIIGMLVIAVVLVMAIVVIAGSNTKTPKLNTASNSPALTAGKVEITANGFVPASLQVRAGDTVTWTNSDTALHQVATDPVGSEDGLPGFVSKTPQQKGETYKYTFSKAGTYTYHDHLDNFKYQGTVIVQ